MMEKIAGKRVAILATDGFEESELFEPKKALEDAGAVTQVVSLKAGKIKSWDKKDWGKSIQVDSTLDDISADEFDALVLPGGVMNPDTLRKEEKAVDFVRNFFSSGKPIAAICHGPWLLVEAGAAKNHRLASWPSLKTDIANAGGTWVDEAVVVDEGIVTSRNPDDIPQFNKKMIEEIAEGKHRQRGMHQSA